MAIKVISIIPPPEILKRILCRRCGATLEYTLNDVQSYSGRDIGGGPDGCEWIDCPNCSARVIIRSW